MNNQELKDLQEQLNNKIEIECQEVYKTNGVVKRKNIRNKIVNEYKTLFVENNIICEVGADGRIYLNFKEDAEKKEQEKQEQIKINTKYFDFEKRVKSGDIENSIRNYIEKKYNNLKVEHSRSSVKSESFYIANEEHEKILKLSLHNTLIQEIMYDTKYIDLSNYYSVIDLKRVIDDQLKELEAI